LNYVFQPLKRNDCQHRFLYPAKLSFIIEGEIKTFQDKEKLKKPMATKAVLQESYTQKRKINSIMKIWERINLLRRVDKQVRIKEESSTTKPIK
jgi:hypothetical protein